SISSSTYRFLVADAKADSMASKMTPLSTPFSLDMASTTNRISLLIFPSLPVESGLKLQIGLVNLAQRHVDFDSVFFDHDHVAAQSAQHAGQPAPTVQGRLQAQSHSLAGEPIVVARLENRSIQAWRRHLQGKIGRAHD